MKTANGKNKNPESGCSNSSDLPNQDVSLKEVLLAWFFGWFGAHKFYRRKYFLGALYILSFGLLCIGWLGDAFRLTLQYIAAHNGKELSKPQKYVSYAAALLCVLILCSCMSPSKAPVNSEDFHESISPVVEVTTEAPTEGSTETTYEAATEALTDAIAEETAETATDVFDSEETTAVSTDASTEAETEETVPQITYILNTSSMKFHYPGCSSVNTISDHNKAEFTGTRDEILARGYSPCGRCHP